ncbi:hypothetical protein AB7M17_006016 [Bradyrhizobium sp. USDA 377]
MPDDHYVARTYLKHFAGDSGKLRAYRKSDGKTFPCASKDICKELDGDTIPEFITDEKLLGKYRAIFEGAWNPAVEALEKRVVDRRNETTRCWLLGKPSDWYADMETHRHRPVQSGH